MNERVVTELIIDASGSVAGSAAFVGAMKKAEAAADSQTMVMSKMPTSLDRITAAFKKVEASIDPVSKAQLQHEREMTRSTALINRAVMMGVTTEENAARIISAIRAKQITELDAVRDAQMRMADTPGVGMRGAGNFNTANLAAQFQDIGVTTAMGMSPLQIALQQGTQISAVLGPMGAAGAVRSLGAAFLAVINPVSLFTIGIIAAGAAAVQYFMKMREDSADSEASLKKQAELISGVAAKWGDALPALKNYNDERQRGEDLQAAMNASEALAGKQFADARDNIKDVNVEIADLVITLQQAGAESDQIVKLQNAFNDLRAKIGDSTATSDDALRVQGELSSLLKSTGIPAIADYAAQFGDLATRIGEAAAKAATFREEAALLDLQNSLSPLDPLNGFRSTPFQNEEELMYARNKTPEEIRTGPGIRQIDRDTGVGVTRFGSDSGEDIESIADSLTESSLYGSRGFGSIDALGRDLGGYFSDLGSRMGGGFNQIDTTFANLGQTLQALYAAGITNPEINYGTRMAGDNPLGSTLSVSRKKVVALGYAPLGTSPLNDMLSRESSTRTVAMQGTFSGSTINLTYQAAPGESEKTSRQRARDMFDELQREAARR